MKNNTMSGGSIYTAIMGIAALAFGVLELIGGEWRALTVEGGLFTPWRAVILLCAGAIYLSSVTNFIDMRQMSKAVLASIMIWIAAAMDIWAMICASIPTGAEEAGKPWINPPAAFLAAYSPPYMLTLYLLIPSLVII